MFDTPKFNYEWNFATTNFTKDKGKVFSCFACGGGSTMGYKLAGFDVIGCNEIDPRMMNMYIKNHNPKYSFLEGIQSFKDRNDLPEELFNLDILDGSPPCSSFSMAGNRDSDWGKEKKFKEGQKKQVLDTLFFDFIDLAKKLQPKVVVAENVTGILIGNAIHYKHRIIKEFKLAGYDIQHFVVNGSHLGLPQSRKRVFFIGVRNDLTKLPQFENYSKFSGLIPLVDLKWNCEPIPFGRIAEDTPDGKQIFACYLPYWKITDLGHTLAQHHPKKSFFSKYRVSPTKPLPTMTAAGDLIHHQYPRWLSDREVKLASSFPLDYDFNGQPASYVCGMSVPPIMTANIASKIYDQWLSKC